ncbi:MAG: hypothetical protein LUC93_02005 [Planctomycetaceae bacterium]|nr:hypothetical protein [Planctomycetaceae bacterium]
MAPIYPPQGKRDETRYRSVKREDREYGEFCLGFCSAVLIRRPDHLEALEVAANHFTELGFYDDGLRLDQVLARIRPGDPGVLYNLACSFALTGRADEAILALSRAVNHGYDNHRHMASDRDLAGIATDPRFRELLVLMQGREGGVEG